MPSCFEKHSRSSLKRWRNWGSGIFGDHKINQQFLMRLGVDESRIRVIPEVVDNTWEEDEALRRYLERERLDSIVITTCRYHSCRAFLDFRESLKDTGVVVYSLPSTNCFYQPDAW